MSQSARIRGIGDASDTRLQRGAGFVATNGRCIAAGVLFLVGGAGPLMIVAAVLALWGFGGRAFGLRELLGLGDRP